MLTNTLNAFVGDTFRRDTGPDTDASIATYCTSFILWNALEEFGTALFDICIDDAATLMGYAVAEDAMERAQDALLADALRDNTLGVSDATGWLYPKH